MSLLEVENIKYKYTDKELYNNASFRILEGEHIVIVGPNGCGKSTFMNIISKNIIPDSGSVLWQNNVTFSYLDQHLVVRNDITIEEYIYGVFKPLYDLEKEMNGYYDMLALAPEADYEKILNRANAISERLEKENFYAINSTIGNVINGLGINLYGMETRLKNLSSGQRAKVYLAKLLLENHDVLLMDEPTNFLDGEHVEWLIKYLNAYKGAFVVISHDEYFIRNIATVVYSIYNKKLTRYKGNYDFYLKESEIRQEHMMREYENQQKFIKQTEQFIEKNRVRATSARQAQSRVKMLEHLEKIERPIETKDIHFSFPFSRGLGQEVLKTTDLLIGYNKALLEPLNILIKQNEKVVILGKNGVGKSTFLKTILGVINSLGGEYKFNPSADINYFKQEDEYPNITPVNYLRQFYPLKTDGDLRGVLAKLGIKGDLAIKSMNELSGGEQTRVRLALMTMKKSNLLILDEPTNHLDINTKEALYEAILEFPGSVILVSHERDFYDGLLDYEINF
ncbi:MAG: ribosomal protection-like ABC-F family protein [Anaeroplasmataceae bacterium]